MSCPGEYPLYQTVDGIPEIGGVSGGDGVPGWDGLPDAGWETR